MVCLIFRIKPFLIIYLFILDLISTCGSPVSFVCRICQVLLMTCPLVQRERLALALAHLEFLAVRVSRATQHSLRFPLTLPLIFRVSVALHPPLSAHLLVPRHPAPVPSLQQLCQVREQITTIRVFPHEHFMFIHFIFAFCS